MRQGPLALVRAAVAGGSLGGLTCALLLRDLGVQVEVYERSPSELVQRGAGIGFLPEAAATWSNVPHLAQLPPGVGARQARCRQSWKAAA